MDVVVVGAGPAARECLDLLTQAGFEVGSDLAQDERCPVVLGDVSHPFSQALQILEAGRHLLIANPAVLSPSQLASLLASRRPRQALFLWSERRQHPAYRLVAGLVRTDENGWAPRYLRLSAFSIERPTAALLRWRACESVALALELAGAEPQALSASQPPSPWRGSPDFLSLNLDLGGVSAFLEVGLGEAVGRFETVLAANDRKAYVDELDTRVPVRLVDDGESALSAGRWVSCPAPGRSELARRQCLAFLEGATAPARSQAEAGLWLTAIACWQAVEASLAAQGAQASVMQPSTAVRRVISSRGAVAASATPPLRIVG